MFWALVQWAIALKSYKQYQETNESSWYDSPDKKMPAWDKNNPYNKKQDIKGCFDMDWRQKRSNGFK